MKSISLYFGCFILCGKFNNGHGSVHDCWDQEKLRRMSFSNNKDQSGDPGLSQFANMLKCLTEQGKGLGGNMEQDWNQWAKVATGGGFAPNWNSNQNQNRNAPEWRKETNNNNDWRTAIEPNINTNRNDNPGYQPKPGVHPDDWGRVRTGDNRNGIDWNDRSRKPLDPGSVVDPWDKDEKNRKRKKERERERELRKQEEKRRKMMMITPGTNPDIQQRYDQATWNNPNPMSGPPPVGTDYSLMTPEETAAISLSRKYGYAIMALSVVVLAVLMVATIFCCNSSNSTMSQANHTLPVNQYDTYSIYSYKGGAGGGVGVADTLRSTGTLGGMSMHTETLKSVQSRGSPQYRVSDIDPDFARRFKETQQY